MNEPFVVHTNNPQGRLTPAFLLVFFSQSRMTSSIPNSFSQDDLQRMLENAQAEPEVDNTRNYDKGYLIDLASQICDEMMERSYGPLIHKVVALTILARLQSWHQDIGEGRIKDDEGGGIGWMLDAGKLQAAGQLLESVSLGDDDFTCE